MAKRDHIGVEVKARLFEKCVSRPAPGVFDRSPLTPGQIDDLRTIGEKRPVEPGGDVRRESLVVVGLVSKSMVEMSEAGQLQVARAIELLHEVRERNGIRAARDGNRDARSSGREIVPPDRVADAVNQLHRDPGRNGETLPALPAPKNAGGQIRTVDPALMRRVLSPTELLRRELLMIHESGNRVIG